jgi:signal transduction histidine kinase
MGLDRSNWLVPLFLILGVLLPTGCVLWFMNDAATSQAAAARQSVTEAYRNQLPLLRDRVEAYWQTRATALDSRAGAGTPAGFARAVKAGVADSIVYLGVNGSPTYPQPLPAFHLDAKPRADLLAAQAQIRGLAQAGNKEAALRAIQESFAAGPLARATDPQGRLIAADEQLLELHLLPRVDRRFAPALQRLTALLNDYEHITMQSAQRLFLMDEVRALDSKAEFPTIEAEHLAAQYLDTGSAPKDAWKLASKSGRVMALYRTSTMVKAMREFLDRQSPSRSARFDMLPPGVAGSGESMEAGGLLPGWRISFALLDTKPLDEAARARRASYWWAGALAIGAMAAMGALAGNVFRRQMRLARLKTDLVAAVSHELKTPLASMRLLVDSLLEDTRLDPVKTREYLQLIAGENQRLTRLIENFLTFSRIERNRQRFDFAPVNPGGLIQAAAHVMRERLQSPACHFETEAAPDLPLLRADEDALIAVLLNLIDNAYKYTPADKRISVRAYRADDEVVFEVTDNGIGIAPRDQKRIFRRFYQVDRRLARETGGCGLGLSIVEFIVRAHGGSVRVMSRPGAGSTFIVRLPYAAELRKAAASAVSLSS